MADWFAAKFAGYTCICGHGISR